MALAAFPNISFQILQTPFLKAPFPIAHIQDPNWSHKITVVAAKGEPILVRNRGFADLTSSSHQLPPVNTYLPSPLLTLVSVSCCRAAWSIIRVAFASACWPCWTLCSAVTGAKKRFCVWNLAAGAGVHLLGSQSHFFSTLFWNKFCWSATTTAPHTAPIITISVIIVFIHPLQKLHVSVLLARLR